jgi:hypothetical protein
VKNRPVPDRITPVNHHGTELARRKSATKKQPGTELASKEERNDMYETHTNHGQEKIRKDQKSWQ